MHLQSILLIPIFAIGVLADDPRISITKDGVDSYLVFAPLATSEAVAGEVYDKCEERDKDGVQINQGEQCLWNAILYMIQALRDAHNVTEVALLSNTVNNMQSIADSPSVNVAGTVSLSSQEPVASTTTTSPSKLRRQDASAREVLWAELNDHISRRSEGGLRPRAVHIGYSSLHPTDGIAIRTNVRSSGATLHVHTNGSHETAAFEKDLISPLGRREAASTTGPDFQFEGAQGLKLQIRAVDEKAYDVFSDLLHELALGKDGKAPKLKESNSWAVVLCKNLFEEPTLWGKLVAEDNGAGNEWESEGLISCKA
jgi:hypothetical protein